MSSSAWYEPVLRTRPTLLSKAPDVNQEKPLTNYSAACQLDDNKLVEPPAVEAKVDDICDDDEVAEICSNYIVQIEEDGKYTIL